MVLSSLFSGAIYKGRQKMLKMKIQRPQMGGGVFVVVVRRRGDRFFAGPLFQDRLRRLAPASPEIFYTFNIIVE